MGDHKLLLNARYIHVRVILGPKFTYPLGAIREIILASRLRQTANGRSVHVTMFSPRLPLSVYCFLVMVSSFMFAISTRIILHYSHILIVYFEET